ncbi:hypothetical protein WJX79_003950 [Trebouxia sp. C0005]
MHEVVALPDTASEEFRTKQKQVLVTTHLQHKPWSTSIDPVLLKKHSKGFGLALPRPFMLQQAEVLASTEVMEFPGNRKLLKLRKQWKEPCMHILRCMLLTMRQRSGRSARGLTMREGMGHAY